MRGLQSEFLVAQYFHQKNYFIIHHRRRTPFAEVDLIIENQKGEQALVEVKTLTHQEWMEERVSPSQKQRLIRACEWWQIQSQKVVVVLVAFVFNKQIKVYSLD